MTKLMPHVCLVGLASLAAMAADGSRDGARPLAQTAEPSDQAIQEYQALRMSVRGDQVVEAQGGVAGDGEPVGACCDFFGSGECVDGLTFCECVATFSPASWSEGQTCAEVSCPPLGSCCLLDTGECTDDLDLVTCQTMGGFWDQNLTCAEVTCPPDFGSGACCLPASGECTDDVGFFDCQAMGGFSSIGLTCADIECPPVEPVGACCVVATETCTPDLTFGECAAAGGDWYFGLACADIECPPLGACCDEASGGCTDASSEAACAAAGGLWFGGRDCAAIECPGDTSCGLSDPSYESGGLSAWVTEDLPIPFFPITAGGSGVQSWPFFFASEPTDGEFALLTGFDGSGPGTISAAQDYEVPAGALILLFDYRAAWDLASFCAVENRTFSVTIEPAGGGKPYETHLFLTAEAGTLVPDTGDLTGHIDVSAYAGTSIRISFEWFVSEPFSGPAFFQLDNIRCLTGDSGRVTICHVPPGNPDNAHTIEVSVFALPAHLAHGDTIGPCNDD